jgi:hypothetical protein
VDVFLTDAIVYRHQTPVFSAFKDELAPATLQQVSSPSAFNQAAFNHYYFPQLSILLMAVMGISSN